MHLPIMTVIRALPSPPLNPITLRHPLLLPMWWGRGTEDVYKMLSTRSCLIIAHPPTICLSRLKVTAVDVWGHKYCVPALS